MVIRPLGIEDVPACLDLAADRDWPREEAKWRLLLGAGQGWGIDSPGGGLAAGTIVTPYDGAAAIGMVLVAARHGGRGLGRRLIGHALSTIGDQPAVLYATAMGFPLYEKLGFRVTGHVTKHVGHWRGAPAPSVAVRPAGAADWSAIAHRDYTAFGADRTKLLDHYARSAEVVVAGPDAYGDTGHAFAFPGGAPGAEIRFVGPVSADSDAVAWALIAHLAARGTTPVRVDISAGHPWLSGLLVEHGLLPRRPDPLMTHGPRLATDWSRYQAIALQALG